MGLLEHLLRREMRRQAYGRRHRRRGYSYGPFGMTRGRRRRRSGVNVRVGGCCLPIPLGLLSSAVLGLRYGRQRLLKSLSTRR